VPLDLYSFREREENPVFLMVNGQKETLVYENGYAVIERKWDRGDVVELALPMPVRHVLAHHEVVEDHHKNAIQRGPLVYCLEGKDQSDERVLNLLVPEDTEYASQFEEKLLGGVQTISFKGNLVKGAGDYMPVNLKAIPYYAWANRGKDNMVVWLPYNIVGTRPLARPTIASKSAITASEGVKGNLADVADQYLPKSAADEGNPFVHWWPKFGSTEWLQYDFQQEEQVGTVRVYWFDDEANGGGCRIPKSWKVQYLENEQWKNAYSPDGFKVVKDAWNEVQFEPVKTKALRIEMTGQDGVSVGVHEWEVK
jgi:hypothetical protein